jgi:DNA-binding NarL/FixJ family response regulator
VQSQNISVALIDDHIMFREAMRHLLREQGFQLVAEASDARASFALIDQHKPNVVLMDLRLPGMDGVTATREIQARAPESKVMILSAYTRQHDLDEAWAAGVHGYVTKMQDAEGLSDAIRAVASGERYLAPGLKPSAAVPAERKGPIGVLSARERDVFRLLVKGMTTRQIAAELTISAKTVDTHRERILKKLGLHSAVELVRFAAYGQLNGMALAIVAGSTALFFLLAVVGYDPQRGMIARTRQAAA